MLVNLTLLLVKEELGLYKLTKCDRKKQEILVNPKLTEDLLSYILKHIPNVYVIVSEEKAREKYKEICKSLEQKKEIEKLIDRGIQQIIETESTPQCTTMICCGK